MAGNARSKTWILPSFKMPSNEVLNIVPGNIFGFIENQNQCSHCVYVYGGECDALPICIRKVLRVLSKYRQKPDATPKRSYNSKSTLDFIRSLHNFRKPYKVQF